MGLLDAILGSDGGSGLLGGLPSSWQWQNPNPPPDASEEKKRQDAAFMAAINQDPHVGGFNPGPSQPGFGAGAAPLPGVQGGQLGASTPYGLGGFNLPGRGPQGTPASGPFPAVPPSPIFAQPQAAPPAPPQAAPAPAPVAPAGPINNMDIGGYQMPQFGSVADYTPQATPAPASSTDISAQSRAPGTPAAFMSPPSTGGFGGAARGAMANMQGGPLGMLAGALGGAMGMGQGSPRDVERQNQKAQYDALIAAGLPPQKAMLAILNPEAAKTLVGEALTNKEKWGEIGSDSFGNKTMGWINERDQTINGKEMGAGGGDGSPVTGFLAPGVKSVDSSLTGKDYLEQFSPEVQAAVRNYAEGKSTPTGNPRKGFTQTVKMIAQKYGEDTGQSIDDTTYAARRTMRNQLSSSAPSSLGGQINIGNTAAGHLADLSQKAVELGNVDMGLAPVSALVNGVRGLGTEQAAKMEALKGAAQHYGQEITKFYAGSPGGTAERDRFIESVNGARSPKELAAILSTEGELMRSRLDALGGQIKGVLGDEGSKQYPVLRPDGEAGLAKVAENVARLKGGQPAATAAPAPLAPGASTTINGVTIKRIN